MVNMPNFEDLPYAVRKSPRKRWNYLKNLLNGNETPTRNVSISVNNGTDPIQGATVKIGEVTKTTGSAGGCSFNGVTDGEHQVIVSADGFTTKTENITVSSKNTSFTISLTSA